MNFIRRAASRVRGGVRAAVRRIRGTRSAGKSGT